MKRNEISQIIQIVCEKLEVKKSHITARNRTREVVEARQIIALLLTEMGLTALTISEVLQQSRENINYHIQRIRNDIEIYPILRKQFEIIKLLTTKTPEPLHESQTLQKPARRLSYSFERRTEDE